jgi:hypothetical protein
MADQTQKPAGGNAGATAAASTRPQMKAFRNVKTSVRAGDISVDGQAHALAALAPQLVIAGNTPENFLAGIVEFFAINSALSGGQEIDVVGKGGTVKTVKPRRDCADGRVAVLSSVDYPTDFASLVKAINSAVESLVKDATKAAASTFQKTDDESGDLLDNLAD